jgi:peptidoglycan/xylan/chitin deacetylase (PgdA/CDA1 family)
MGPCKAEAGGIGLLSLFTILRGHPRRIGLKPGEVILSFDDGPNLDDDVTPRLLNVLHQHSVKAAFCVVGKLVRRHPEVIRRMRRSGHLIVNHTEHHEHPVRQNLATLVREIKACDRAIGDALSIPNYRSEFFRAPFGIVTPAVRRATKRMGMQPLLLTHYGWDTRVGPADCRPVVDILIENAKRLRGGLYVFHDGSLCPPRVAEPDWNRSVENRSWVPEAVDRVITELKAAGLQFVLPQTGLQIADDSPRIAA